MKKEYILYLFLFASIVIFPFLLYSMIVIMPNSAWHGFGVDASQRVYVGKYDKILCYENCEIVSSFSIPKYKTYYFTVHEDDTILVCNSTDIDLYSLTGDLIGTYEKNGSSKYHELQWKKVVEAPNGDIYSVKNTLGFRTILKNGEEVVYRTPIHEYFLFLLTIVSLFLVIGLAILMCVLYVPKIINSPRF